MGLSAYLGRISIRRRWPRYAGIALLLGVTAGLSLFAIAGARRTQSAYPRFLRHANASTLAVSVGPYDSGVDAAVASFPEVKQASTYIGMQVAVLVDHRLAFPEIEVSGSFDGRYIRQDRFTVTRGRLPDPARDDEVAINEVTAKRYHFRVGQPIELGAYSLDQFSDPGFRMAPWPESQRVTATVVGIGLFPDEVLQDDGDRNGRILVTGSYSRSMRPYITYGIQGLVLAHGDADVGAVTARFTSLVPPGASKFRATSVDLFHAQQAIRPLTIALGLFGFIIGAAGLVLVGQAMSRLLVLEREERAILRGLGAGTAAIVRATLVGPGVAILAGTTLAVALAVAASPAMPIGPVRRVEVTPGLNLDRIVLGLGGVVLVVALLSLVAVMAWRESVPSAADHQDSPGQPGKIVTAASSLGMGPAAVIGLRFALEPTDGGRSVPTRSVIAGAAVAIMALVGSLTFGASLTRLVHEPRLYGWNWDVAAVDGRGYGNVDAGLARAVLGQDPHIEAWSGAYFGAGTIDGHDVPMLGMDPGNAVMPPNFHGRAILRSGEIVLGAATAARLHKRIGDAVNLAGEGTGHRLIVVGIAVFPTVGIVHAAHTSLGVGALVVPELVPGFDRDIHNAKASVPLGPRVLFIRYRPGTDAKAELRRLQQTTKPIADFAQLEVLPVQRPAEIVNSSSIGNVPFLLAAALALGAIISLILALGTSVRRHRHDLAVLKTLGFTRGQISRTIFWHATTTIILGLVLGIPLGAALGRSLWNAFAHRLDVIAAPTVPLIAVVAIAVAAVVVANAVSAVPARAARRVNPATLLRSE